MSEEKLSSWPPSFPRASTQKRADWPSSIVPRFAISGGSIAAGKRHSTRAGRESPNRVNSSTAVGWRRGRYVAKGDAEHHFFAASAAAGPEACRRAPSPPSGRRRCRRAIRRARLVAIIGLAIVRFLEPEGIPGILEQKPGVERTCIGQTLDPEPGVRRKRARVPGRMFLAKQGTEFPGQKRDQWARSQADLMAAEKIARLVEQALLLLGQRAEALAIDLVENAVHFDTQVVTIVRFT